jgi:hypothetical protein
MNRKGEVSLTLIQSLENYSSLIAVNLKLSTLTNLLTSIALLCALPLVQGVSSLDKIAAAICLENFVVIIGIVLLVPIFSLEEAKEIDEIISSKPMSKFKPYLMRTVLAVVSALVLITAFCIMLRYNLCTFDILPYILGTFASALFLGSIGMTASSLSGSTIIGYMMSIGYLIINLMTANKYVGKFYIMSMRNNSFDEKYYLLLGAIALIVLAISIKSVRFKLRIQVKKLFY